MATVNLFDANINTGPAIKSIAGLEEELMQLQDQFKSAEIGSAEWNRLGQAIQKTQGQLKTFEERFEGLGIEQKNAAIVDSFNVVAGSIGAVTGAMVALGFESDALQGVEKRLLGIITTVSSLREVSNGLAAAQKTLVPAFTKAAAAARAFALANPFTAVAVALTALIALTYKYITAQDEENDAIAQYNKRIEEQTKLEKGRLEVREQAFTLAAREAKITEGERAGLIQQLNDIREKISDARAEVKRASKVYDEELNKLNKLRLLLLETPGSKALEEAFKTQLDRVNEFNVTLNKTRGTLQSLKLDQVEYRKTVKKLDADAEKERKEAAKKAKEDADKAAEDLAKRAVKQLQDQKQATEDLIALYSELYPEVREGGAYDFSTAINRINYELALQIELTRSLTDNYEDLGAQLEEVTDDAGESFFSEQQLGVFKKLRDASKSQLEVQLEALHQTYLEDLSLFSDNEEMKSKITEQYEEDRAKLRRQYALQTAQNLLGITSQFLNTIADINQQSLELQLAQAQGNEQKILQIQAEALQKQKKLRIAQIAVSTAESVISAFNVTASIPPPFGQIIGGILAASYVALGAKAIQNVNAASIEGGGGTGGFNNSPGGGGGISLPTGGGTQIPTSGGNILPGLPGGGRLGTPGGVGTVQAPIQAYVLASDVSNGQQAAAAISNRRRLAGG